MQGLIEESNNLCMIEKKENLYELNVPCSNPGSQTDVLNTFPSI